MFRSTSTTAQQQRQQQQQLNFTNEKKRFVTKELIGELCPLQGRVSKVISKKRFIVFKF